MYVVRSKSFTVTEETTNLNLRLERWIETSRFGFYSGDHHIHGAGCSHYESPTQGVTPEDMFAYYGSNRGSIYGISSNSKTTAFRRPANRNREINGLFFAGGSSHPGGGVPFPVDSGSAFMPPPTTRRRQRAPIKADTYRAPEVEANNNRGSSMDSSSRGMQPPEPPVRKDSFNRGGGGDLIPHHSPQTSDSTLKSFQLQSSNNSSPTKAFSQSQQQPQNTNQPPPLPQTDPPPRPSQHTHPDRKKNAAPEDLFGSYSVNTIDSSTSSHHRRMMRASGSSVDSVRNPQNLRTPPKLIGGNIADNGIDSSIVSVPSPVRPTPMRPSTLGPPQSRSAKKDNR